MYTARGHLQRDIRQCMETAEMLADTDRLDTDGCMSTNDTVLLMASGASGTKPDHRDFTRALIEVCADLARQLQLDAEGASKMITIEVVGAAREDDAVTVGIGIARERDVELVLQAD